MSAVMKNALARVQRFLPDAFSRARIAEKLRALKVFAGKRPAGAVAMLGLLALLLVAGRWISWLQPVELGDPFGWASPAARQQIADILNENVLIDGFQARVHLVKRGENLWGIASKTRLNIDTIVGCNPALTNLDAWIDQSLLLVNRKGCLHVVAGKESLRLVAEDYGVEPDVITAANRVSLFGLREGELLFIPGAGPVHLMTREMKELYGRRRLFRSPLAGDYTSLMGRRSDPFTGASKHHGGVDIRAKRNQLVGAAAGGKVVFAERKSSYGKLVIIDHGNGYRTYYGHLNKISVTRGQRVNRHHYIGRVGSTGRATGPHLHFEIRYRGKVQDPLKYLW